MTTDHGGCYAWNDEAKVACTFAFKCPKTWERLTPTETPSIRHCPACDRDVHLALTEEDFRRHADAGHCVAVRGLTHAAATEPGYIVGSLDPAYGGYLRRG